MAVKKYLSHSLGWKITKEEYGFGYEQDSRQMRRPHCGPLEGELLTPLGHCEYRQVPCLVGRKAP